jgi:hypothetical protein
MDEQLTYEQTSVQHYPAILSRPKAGTLRESIIVDSAVTKDYNTSHYGHGVSPWVEYSHHYTAAPIEKRRGTENHRGLGSQGTKVIHILWAQTLPSGAPILESGFRSATFSIQHMHVQRFLHVALTCGGKMNRHDGYEVPERLLMDLYVGVAKLQGCSLYACFGGDLSPSPDWDSNILVGDPLSVRSHLWHDSAGACSAWAAFGTLTVERYHDDDFSRRRESERNTHIKSRSSISPTSVSAVDAAHSTGPAACPCPCPCPRRIPAPSSVCQKRPSMANAL